MVVKELREKEQYNKREQNICKVSRISKVRFQYFAHFNILMIKDALMQI